MGALVSIDRWLFTIFGALVSTDREWILPVQGCFGKHGSGSLVGRAALDMDLEESDLEFSSASLSDFLGVTFSFLSMMSIFLDETFYPSTGLSVPSTYFSMVGRRSDLGCLGKHGSFATRSSVLG